MQIIRQIRCAALILLVLPACSDGLPDWDPSQTDTATDYSGIRFELESTELEEEEETIYYKK